MKASMILPYADKTCRRHVVFNIRTGCTSSTKMFKFFNKNNLNSAYGKSKRLVSTQFKHEMTSYVSMKEKNKVI